MLFRWHNRVLLYCFLSHLAFVAESAVDPIIIKGSKFFYKNNGSEFSVRGLIYRDRKRFPDGSVAFLDPLQDEIACRRDINHILKLGINTIFINAYNSGVDHAACIDLFQNHGIYILMALNGHSNLDFRFNNSLAAPFDHSLVEYSRKIIDVFQKYDNSLGFVIRNSFRATRPSLPWIQPKSLTPIYKALVRDAKEYMNQKGYRLIPVGATSLHYFNWQTPVPQYMMCGDSSEDDAAMDFWHLDPEHDTIWCLNSSSYLTALTDMYKPLQRPIILTHGCTQAETHDWSEISEIYSPPVSNVFAGTIFYQWFDSSDKDNSSRGLVEITRNGNDVKPLQQYFAISSQLAAIAPSPTLLADYHPETAPILCEDYHYEGAKEPRFIVKNTIPTRFSPRLCNCMMQTLECVANPSGSQDQLGLITDTIMKECNSTTTDSYCFGLVKDTSRGRFDSFAFCSSREQASWTLQKYQESLVQNGSTNSIEAELCSRAGGIVQKPTATASLASDCQNLLRQAGPAGTGTITAIPAVADDIKETTNDSNSSSFSAGAKAGIGVGITIGLTLLLSILLVYVRAKRRKAAQQKVAEASLEDNVSEPTEMGAGKREMQEMDTSPESPGPELEGSLPTISEAVGDHGAVEVFGDHGAVELPTSYNETLDTMLRGRQVKSS